MNELQKALHEEEDIMLSQGNSLDQQASSTRCAEEPNLGTIYSYCHDMVRAIARMRVKSQKERFALALLMQSSYNTIYLRMITKPRSFWA
jgi:hypothetical protein